MRRRTFFKPNEHAVANQPQIEEEQAKSEELPTIVKPPLIREEPAPPPPTRNHLTPAQAIRNAQRKKKR